MPKIKIEFDKTNCIGALACVSIDPDRWEEHEDKVNLIGGKEVSEGIFILEKEVSEDEVERIKEGAEVCPVAVVGVTNLDTGEVLFKREVVNN